MAQLKSKTCPECGSAETFVVTDEQFNEYTNDPLPRNIQDIFPEFTAEQRERLMTGYCPKCWDNLFNVDHNDDNEYGGGFDDPGRGLFDPVIGGDNVMVNQYVVFFGENGIWRILGSANNVRDALTVAKHGVTGLARVAGKFVIVDLNGAAFIPTEV